MADQVCSLPKPSGPVTLDAGLAIGPAPAPESLAALHAAGYRTLVNNQPDTDQDLAATSAEMAAAAAAAGLDYVHIPVEGRNPLEKDVRAFARALDRLPRPIFAFCRSGGRSAALWAMARVREHDTETLIARCREVGFDVSGLRAKMDMRRELLAEEDTDDDA
jgi:sulfide:quinone oxidoreductase